MSDEIREILDKLKDTADTSFFAVCSSQEELDKMPKSITKILSIPSKDAKKLLDYITNLQKENERLNKEVAKLHIIQEEYGSHIENTHIIDDYQKTYFMSNKWLIELKNGRFVDINVLNSYYEDYKSRVEKAVEYINKYEVCLIKNGIPEISRTHLLNILQNGSDDND